MNMHKQDNNSKFRPLAVMVILICVLFFGNSVEFLSAAEGDATTQTGSNKTPGASQDENLECQEEMGKFLDVELGKYREWMKKHFENKSSTSSLTDDAIARYEEFRAVTMKEYYKHMPFEGASQLTEGLESGACLNQVREKLSDAMREVENRAKSTSTVRQSTALSDKYQQINNQLGGMAKDVLTMKAYLDTFADKLPCYVKKNCNKG